MTIREIEKQIRSQAPLRHSIRHQMMMMFIGLIAFMLLAIWAVNNFWLEHYYVKQKLKVMEEAYGAVDQVVMQKTGEGRNIASVILDELQEERAAWKIPAQSRSEESGKTSDSILSVIRAYGEENNITTVLIDSSTGNIFLDVGREGDFLARKVQGYVLGKGGDDAHILKKHENYVVETNQDYRSNSGYMESWGFLSDNNTLFIMSMPLSSIHESVALSNRFITWVGLTVMAVGGVLVYIATNRITKPLLKLAALSERMSHLDFDVSYQDDAENEIGILGMSMNTLSEKLKETIGALREANCQLQHDIDEKTQIDEMRKEFIANVSHELKTPIALIQGYAEGLTEGMCEDEESRNYYCEVIMDEAGKMNKMVKQLLTLTALEFGNDAPVMGVFDAAELVQDLINSSSILLQQNDAHVEYRSGGPVYVYADEFKIEEVLTNYLTNAIHHLGGERTIRIELKKEEGLVRLSVFNTGDPIPEADLPNLWTKFYKVDKARTRAYGGSGIGLSIVKAIADAHHQQCGVANVEGGVEFWFTMKIPDSSQEQAALE